MSLAAGKLRHRVQLQMQVQTQDSQTGEAIISWVDVGGKVWAFVRYASARDFRQSAADQSEAIGDLTIRYRSDIGPTWRALHKGRPLNLKAPLADDGSGNEYLTIPFTEGVSQG